MKKIAPSFRLILSVLSLAVAATASAQSIPGDWKLTFSDEFNGTELDATKWRVGYHFNAVINSEKQHYVPENVLVSNGTLKLKAEQRETSAPPMKLVQHYASGEIETWGKFTQTYGLFEARMKMPKAKGLWPAFWLMPDRGEQSPEKERMSTFNGGMEIDVLEHLTAWGGYAHSGVIWDGYRKGNHSKGGGGPQNAMYQVDKMSDEFHTYSVFWDKDRVMFLIDGRITDGIQSDRVASVPMHLILNCAVGGKWPETLGRIEDAALPDNTEVDWVHVYSGTIDPKFYVPDLNSLSYQLGRKPWKIPATIEAENFNDGLRGVAWWDQDDWSQGTFRNYCKGVDATPTEIVKGAYGEWLTYTVESAAAAPYTVTIRARAPEPAAFLVFLDDATEPLLTLTDFGVEWTERTSSAVPIPAGVHKLKVMMKGKKDIEFDWIKLAL